MIEWLSRRATDDLVAAVEDRLDLDDDPSTEGEVQALMIKALNALSDKSVLRARRRVSKCVTAKPLLAEAVRRRVDGMLDASR